VASALITTGGGATLAFAFFVFGKRRRDGAPPAPDAVLEAAAARGSGFVARGGLVPELAMPGGGPAPAFEPDGHLPRWRRPSLIEARKKDPTREAHALQLLSFDHGLVAPVDDAERRIVRYTIVRLLDTPDELRGEEVGVLGQGDEIQVLGSEGVYRFVHCPDGRRGGVHPMPLGEPPGAADVPTGEDLLASRGRAEEDIDPDVLDAFFAARGIS
jgi:hypothetical protein